MEFKPFHEWPTNPNDAIKIQHELRSKVVVESSFENVELITALDTAYNNEYNRLYAAAVTMSYSELSCIERSVAEMEAHFPYVPALMAFREGPVILKALSRLQTKPDIIVYPGHGIAHPRSLGMASHLGLITGIPSIGCARKKLIGDYRMPSREKGSCASLFLSNVEVGLVYRSKDNVRPVFVTPGHMCSIRDAIDIVIHCLTEYRMPEPLRLAHLYANKYKQGAAAKRLGQKKKAIST